MIALILYIYLIIGLLFAILFVTIGVHKVDADMHNAPVGMRLILIPGSVLLWPVMMIKWIKVKE